MNRLFSVGIIFLLIFMSFQLVRAQGSPFFATRIGLETWSIGGAHVARLNNPAAPMHNPASLMTSGLDVYLEVGSTFRTKYLDFEPDKKYLPGYISFSTLIKDFHLAVGYANNYNFDIDSGPENPDKPSEGRGLKNKIIMHTFFAIVRYPLHEKIVLGATIGVNYLKETEEFKGLELGFRGNGWGPQIIIGLLYSPIKKLTFGTSFHFLNEIDLKNDFTTPVRDDTSRGTSRIILGMDRLNVKFPWSLQFGLRYETVSFLHLYAMLDYQRWSKVLEAFDDKLQVHLGAKIIPASQFTLGLGFFTLNDPGAQFLDQKFLTFGIQFKIHKNFGFYASLLDSHLLSHKKAKQTFLGAGFKFSKNGLLNL